MKKYVYVGNYFSLSLYERLKFHYKICIYNYGLYAKHSQISRTRTFEESNRIWHY
jgi:hypothetical protein